MALNSNLSVGGRFREQGEDLFFALSQYAWLP